MPAQKIPLMLAITRRHLLILLALCPLAMATRAGAEHSTSWINPTFGDWFIASNWNNGLPGADSTATIGWRDDLLGTALFNGTPGDGSVGTLNVWGGKVILATGHAIMIVQDTIHVGGNEDQVAELDITTGAWVFAHNPDIFPDLLIGEGYHTTGVVHVQDPGSILSVGRLFMGVTVCCGTGVPAAGVLTVENGALARSGFGPLGAEGFQILGLNDATSGSVTVTGTGSVWEVDNDFIIGAHGTGSVLIANGGKVDGAGLTLIGQGGYDSNGTVTVTGSGSLWDQKGNVFVGGRPDGNGGSGALHVRAGGLVRAHHLKFFSNSTLDIDNGSRAVAGLQIVGGSAPPAAGGTLGDMVVGLNTSGRMEISGGGTVTSARGYTGFNAGSDAVTTVSGAGSRWNCSGSIWTGNAGTGALEITNGAVVTSTGNGYLGFSPGASGFVRVNGAGSSWTTALTVYVGGNGNGAGGSGAIQIDTGGTVGATETKLYPSGALNLGANATLTGLLTSLGGQIKTVADLTLVNDVTLGAGGLRVETQGHAAVFSGAFTGTGGLTKSGGFFGGTGTLTLTGTSTYSGPTTVPDGKLFVDGSIASAVTVSGQGTLGGNGTVGTVVNDTGGTVAPGRSVGRLTINGIYSQSSTGTLAIEIGGYTPGTGYDQVSVSGPAVVGGTLRLSLVNGFRPNVGDTFVIVTSSSASGSFATITGTGFSGTAAATAAGIVVTVTAVDPPVLTPTPTFSPTATPATPTGTPTVSTTPQGGDADRLGDAGRDPDRGRGGAEYPEMSGRDRREIRGIRAGEAHRPAAMSRETRRATTPSVAATPTAPSTPAVTPTASVEAGSIRKCRAAIVARSAAFAQARLAALQQCRAKIVAGKLAGLCPGDDPKTTRKIADALQLMRAGIAKACGGRNKVCSATDTGADRDVRRADVGFPALCPTFEGGCSSAVADRDCTGVATCLECIGGAVVDQAIALYYDVTPTDPKAARALNGCQQAIGKNAVKLFTARSKALQDCWSKVSNGKHPGPCPDAAKADPAIAKATSRAEAAIAKACCGKNKTCNLLDGGVDADFDPVTDIGFPGDCANVTVPAGRACAGTITDMQSLIACVGCVTEFKVDCLSAAQFPGVVTPYPAECE